MELSYLVVILGALVSLSVAERRPPPPAFMGMPPPLPPPPGILMPYDFPDFSNFPLPPPMPLGAPPPPSIISEVLFPPPPQPKPDDTAGLNMTKYAYDNAGRVAQEVYRLVHIPVGEFLGTHMYFMSESHTARAISEYIDKVTYAKNNGGEECLANGEEAAIKDFRKRLAKVVWGCEAGWQISADLGTKAQALMTTIDGLDKQANETLKGCKPGETCYDDFKKSSLAASIDKQLMEIRKNQLIDLRVLADQDHVTSLYNLYKCNVDNSDSLRSDIYTSIAKINVCISTIGLITQMT